MREEEKSRTVTEPQRDTPVRCEVDVLVAGGGLGGISAAMSAARAGAKTLLIERNGFLGGVATAGMCCSIFNCYYTADRRLGITGNAVEVADALAQAEGYGTKWHQHKGHIIYDVEQAKQILESLVEDAGAEVLYDTVICGAVMEGTTLCGVVVESKSGREAILAKCVVDATGDADVAARCGVPLHTRVPRPAHSFCFRMGRVNVDEFVQYFADHPDQYPDYMDVDWTVEEALEQYRECGTFLFPHGGAMQMSVFQQALEAGQFPETVGVHDTLNACQMHALRSKGVVHLVTGFVHFDDLDISKISRSAIDGRRMAYVVTDFFSQHLPGFQDAFVVATADDLGIRASRWIDAEFVFTRAMKENPTTFGDAVGRGVVERDIVKHPGKRAWGVQTFTNDTFDIPYRCLLPNDVEGLIMGAGRSISAEHPFLLRVMALTMVVGQGAGVAAAVAAKGNDSLRNVDLADVQSELQRQGVAIC